MIFTNQDNSLEIKNNSLDADHLYIREDDCEYDLSERSQVEEENPQIPKLGAS